MTSPFDADEPESQPSPAALAATEGPVELSVALIDDDRTPEGMVCMATYRHGRLVARCALPPEAWDQLHAHHLLDQPVPVVLVAREAPPGLQCQLFAMVTLPPDLQLQLEGEDEREPWATSVPGSGYEAAALEAEDGDPAVAPIPLGNIVRYTKDRVHPDSLPLEAADILRRIIEGKAVEVVDKALEQ